MNINNSIIGNEIFYKGRKGVVYAVDKLNRPTHIISIEDAISPETGEFPHHLVKKKAKELRKSKNEYWKIPSKTDLIPLFKNREIFYKNNLKISKFSKLRLIGAENHRNWLWTSSVKRDDTSRAYCLDLSDYNFYDDSILGKSNTYRLKLIARIHYND